jgi:hypothetical protein
MPGNNPESTRSAGMSDIMSILQSAYTSAGLVSPSPSNTPYTKVDPATYQGTWSGTYTNNQKFQLTVSQVSGFRAEVKYQDSSGVSYQSVLIKAGSFRVGNSKFTLTTPLTPAVAATANAPATAAQGGVASVKTAVTDPVTGSTSLITGNATQDV